MTISDITKNRFKVILSEKLILDYADGKFRMHFTDQDKTSVSSGRSMRYVEVEEVENLKILADTSSVEVFVNDGEYVFSRRSPYIKRKSFSREIFKRYMVIFNTNVYNRSCQW